MSVVGIVLLLGLAVDTLGRRTRLPRVTLLLMLGLAIGPEGIGLIGDPTPAWFASAADVALLVIGFLLGERFTARLLREQGRDVLWISAGVALASAAAVAVGLVLLGAPWELSLLLGGIATATDPAATVDAVEEGRADGPFTRTLLGIVAIDDAWGLVAFSLLLAAATAVGGSASAADSLATALRDLGGAVALGAALGVPAAYLTGRVAPGEPSLLEGLGVVLLCGGLARYFEVSFLLAAMTLGAVIANLARHHTRPFHAIEGIERPILILFFVLSGASFRIDALPALGWIGVAYLVLRAAGRVLGARAGAGIAASPAPTRRWMGLALMPQAGVALGMALVAAERLPELAEVLLSVVVGTTVVFELIGPLCTRWALSSVGEVASAD